MYFVAVTGGIASGKSTVSQIMADEGYPVIDADKIARKVVEPGKRAWEKLKKEFGNEILNFDGTLNREKLGTIIFENKEKRKTLNLITHPEIIKEMIFSALLIGLKGYPFVVLDIPLLYESGELVQLMNKVIVVNCTEDIQIQRLMARNNLSKEAALLRISSQMPLEEKCKQADYVIENSSDLKDMKAQVYKVIADLNDSAFNHRFKLFVWIVVLLFFLFICYTCWVR